MYFWFPVGVGACLGYMAVFPVMVRNFSMNQRGRIIGIMDAFFSLGPAIFAAIYGAVFVQGHIYDEENQNLWGFFLFSALAFVIIFTLGMIFVRPISCEETDMSENSHLITPQASSVLSQTEPEVPRKAIDLTGCALFRNTDFHLILWPFIMCTSVQLMFINNIPAYLTAFRNESYNTLLTVLSPVIQVLTKLTVGTLSDLTLSKVPRITYLLICNATQTVFLILCIFFVNDVILFLFATIAVSIAVGGAWSLNPAMLGDMFGTRYFGRNWGWLILGLSVGGLVLQAAYGVLYDAQVNTNKQCYGKHCFFWSFIIAVILSLVSVLLNSRLLYVKLRHKTYNPLRGN